MNWDAIGSIGEIIGAAAVLITLIYLAMQVKQTNDISRYNSAKDVMAKFDSINDRLVSDGGLRQALTKEGALTQDEEELLYAFANMFLNTWVICQSAYDNGLIDDGFYQMAKKDVLFEIERWPNFAVSVGRVMDNYPAFKAYPIFESIEQP